MLSQISQGLTPTYLILKLINKWENRYGVSWIQKCGMYTLNSSTTSGGYCRIGTSVLLSLYKLQPIMCNFNYVHTRTCNCYKSYDSINFPNITDVATLLNDCRFLCLGLCAPLVKVEDSQPLTSVSCTALKWSMVVVLGNQSMHQLKRWPCYLLMGFCADTHTVTCTVFSLCLH